MERLASKISRHLYLIPGGYFIVQLMKACFSRKNGSNTARTFSFRGITMKVDTAKSMGSAIYWRGAHDWAPIFVLEKHIQPGDCIIDIGANQGEYTLWAARKAGKKGKVVSFEPMDQLFDTLLDNISLNPSFSDRILPIKKGLSDKASQLCLYGKPGDNEGVNTMFPTSSHTELIQEIALDTLDRELEKLQMPRVSLIKLDVEGAELQVLKGSKKTILEFKPKWIIEINEEACQAGGYTSQDILEFLKGFGYIFYKIGLRGKLTKIEKVEDAFVNILALPLEKQL